MLVSSTNEFQAFMFEQLHFLPEMNGIIPVTVTGNTRKVGIAVFIAARGVISLGLRIIRFRRIFGFFSESCETASVWGNAFREDAF